MWEIITQTYKIKIYKLNVKTYYMYFNKTKLSYKIIWHLHSYHTKYTDIFKKIDFFVQNEKAKKQFSSKFAKYIFYAIFALCNIYYDEY